MTLRHFLDAAYTILVDENSRLNGNLMGALDDAAIWRAGGPPEEVVPGASIEEVPPAVERQIERENTKALMELQKMMAGVSGGPSV